MILNNSDYNPLPTILGIMPLKMHDMTAEILSAIQSELFKGGVVPENIQEFDATLGLLRETLKVYYGKE
jgi:hypothetical protein